MGMLKQDFFTKGDVETVAGGLRCANWEIPSALSYFEGHFPHLPVLPAVAIVDISLALIQAGRPQQTCRLEQVISAKFHQPLAPGSRVHIVADEETGEWNIEWRVLVMTDEQEPNTSGVAAQLRLHVGS